jgi:hypothetical protein
MALLCLSLTSGCAPKRPAVETSSRAVPLSASLPNLERFDIPEGKPVAAKTESERVDAYLSWLHTFEIAKLQTNTQLAERLKALAPVRIPNYDEPALEKDPDQDNPRSEEETLAAMKEVAATTEKIAATFRSRPEAPPECETLAKLYSTALSKNLGALQRIAQQRAANVQAIRQGTYDPSLADRAAGTASDNGAAEMAEANRELQQLFQRYPGLKTAPFQFAF